MSHPNMIKDTTDNPTQPTSPHAGPLLSGRAARDSVSGLPGAA